MVTMAGEDDEEEVGTELVGEDTDGGVFHARVDEPLQPPEWTKELPEWAPEGVINGRGIITPSRAHYFGVV